MSPSGAEVRVCTPPDFAELLAGVARFDTVSAAAEECVAPATAGVTPTGVWR